MCIRDRSYIPNCIGSYTHDLYEAEASQISDRFEEVQQLIHVRDTMYTNLQACLLYTSRKSLGAYYAAGKYHLHDQESFHISGSLHVYRGF